MANRLNEFIQFVVYLFDTTDYRKMPYRQYLQTYHWRHLRSLKLAEVDERCQLCYSAKKPLHVHHRTYARLGNEKLTDLTVLCKKCHEMFHTYQTLDNPPGKVYNKRKK